MKEEIALLKKRVSFIIYQLYEKIEELERRIDDIEN